jgi:hypothetical protein
VDMRGGGSIVGIALVWIAAGCRIGFDPIAGGGEDGGGSEAPPGAVCTDDTACETGICADGRCCDSRCDQPCTACGPSGSCEPTLGTLMLSTLDDRSSPVRLEGRTLGERSFIFLEPCIELQQVTYRIDAADAVDANVEANIPFDLAGTNTNGQPRPLLAGMLAPGARLLYAACEATNGETHTLAAVVEATGTPGIKLSGRPDRTAAMPLHSASVSGDAYIFYVDDGVPFDRRTSFYVDDAQANGSPTTVEDSVPFDLAGGNGPADPFDTTSLANGTHTLTVVVEQPDGSATSETASFDVVNP